MMTVNQKSLLKIIQHRFNCNTLAYMLILLFSFLILSPIILPKIWPRVHDLDRYIVLLDHFRDATLNGIFYPRWHLFSRSWGFGLSGKRGPGSDNLSFQLGLIHFILAVIGFWLLKKNESSGFHLSYISC